MTEELGPTKQNKQWVAQSRTFFSIGTHTDEWIFILKSKLL